MELSDSEQKNILPYGGNLIYYDDFFTKDEADHYLCQLRAETIWKQEEIIMFGKKVLQPRLTALYGDMPYTYSGVTMHTHKWTDILNELKSKVEQAADQAFNTVLINMYRTGEEYMGWHRDNEKELGTDPVIASISLGAERTFQVRDYKTKEEKIALDLSHGSLLLMGGSMQTNWEHQLPKRTKVGTDRINLTFRQIQVTPQ